MKKNLFLLAFTVLLTFSLLITAQVGINTENPLATLDINGNLRVRTVDECVGESCGDSILVKNNGGFVQSMSIKKLIDSHYKTFLYGTGSGATVTASNVIMTGWRRIEFNDILIDENNDFDATSYTFTAPKKGIYEVYVQYQTSALISAEDLGIGIFVKKGNATPTIAAQETYLNVNLLGVAVSPSTRRTQTLVSLDSGDQVFFGAKSLSALSLSSGSNSFFNIQQVK